MKNSKLVILFVVLVLIFSAGKVWGQADVNDIKNHNTSTKYLPISAEKLSQCDWNSPNNCKSCVENWQEYTGKQDYTRLKVLNITYFTLFDTNFVAEYRFFTEKQYYQILIKPAGDVNSSRDLFTKFFSAVKNDFGKPVQIVDLSYVENKESEHLEILADWILGSTRVRLTGSGVKTHGNWILIIFGLQISERKVSPDLRQPVYLKLEGQTHTVGGENDSQVSLFQPRILILDLNNNCLLTQNYNPFCDLTTVTEDYLGAKWEQKKHNNELIIDRRLGTFLWKIRQSGVGADASGTIAVLPELPKTKF